MNIAYISSLASLQGGGQRSLYLLLKYLNKEKYAPCLIVPAEGELSRVVRKLGIEAFALPFPRLRSLRFDQSLAALKGLLRIIKEKKIDILHLEGPRELFYSFVAKKFTGVHIVTHLRVSDTFMSFDRFLYALSDSLIAVSNAVAARFVSVDRVGKVRVVYNGVELESYKVRDAGQKAEGFLKIGYFGRIDRRKGIEVLINAVQGMKERIELLIMGSGDNAYLNELKALSGGCGNITFKGYKPDIIEELSETDAVVLPAYRGEGLSRILMEALAMGKIAVASDLDTNRELLGQEFKEFLFPVGDVKALKEVLERIASDKEIYFKKKDILRKRAEIIFDIRKNTQAIENIYDSLRRVHENRC